MYTYPSLYLFEFYELAVALTGADTLTLPVKYFGQRKASRRLFEGIIAGRGLEEDDKLMRRVERKGLVINTYPEVRRLKVEIVEMATDWLFDVFGRCHLVPPPCLINLSGRQELGCRSKPFIVMLIALQLNCIRIAGVLIHGLAEYIGQYTESERRVMGDGLARTAFLFNRDFPSPMNLLQQRDRDSLPKRLKARRDLLRLTDLNHSIVLHSF